MYIYICIYSIILLPQKLKHRETQRKMRKSVMTDVSTWHLSMLVLLGKMAGPLEAVCFPDAMDMPNWYEPRQSGQASDVTKTARGEPASPEGGFLVKERWLSLNNAEIFLLTGATASFADGRTWGQSIYSLFIHSFLLFFFNLTALNPSWMEASITEQQDRCNSLASELQKKSAHVEDRDLIGAEARHLWMKPFETPNMFKAVTGVGAAHKTDMFCTASCRLSQEVFGKNCPLNSFPKKLRWPTVSNKQVETRENFDRSVGISP